MIVEAIDALKQKEGANKSAISKYIESKYGDLPAGHSTLLTVHLTRMKESGELVFFKNNYQMPDPTAPLRRGRGRPQKPKDPAAQGAVASPPRHRGRAKKEPKDKSAPKKPKPENAKLAAAKNGRPRGRAREGQP